MWKDRWTDYGNNWLGTKTSNKYVLPVRAFFLSAWPRAICLSTYIHVHPSTEGRFVVVAVGAAVVVVVAVLRGTDSVGEVLFVVVVFGG